MTPDSTPVLVGAGQLVQRDVELALALSPLAMLEQTARAAAADAGLTERALTGLDTVGIVDVVAWRTKNPPRFLAERLGAQPRRALLSATGGEVPLRMVNEIAESIRAGDARMALVAGCNNLRTLRRARRAKVRLDWAAGGDGEPELVGENRPGSSELEQAYGLRAPPEIYPIFENALRARRGLGLEEHRQNIGKLMSRFSRVAAGNPYAWFPVARSPEEIATATPRNRMIAYPYTKYMNAVIETDQAAAVLLLSAGTARRLGVPEERWVYWWGGTHDEESAWWPSERPDFARCDALGAAVGGALAQAGVSLDDVDHFDIYSCFPVAVEMACEMLGLAEDDARGFTVTGGLPYAGGPANNYTIHSLAAMMERLRERPGARGLVTGNGWYFTKYAATVCASAPPEGAARAGGPLRKNGAPVVPVDAPSGRGSVETYTALYERDGAPARGIVIGTLEDGRRFLANTPEDRDVLEAFTAVENVGRAGRVSRVRDRTVFDPA